MPSIEECAKIYAKECASPHFTEAAILAWLIDLQKSDMENKEKGPA